MPTLISPIQRPALRVASLALAAGLAACGGSGGNGNHDGTPDPLQKYRDQAVQWTECDPTIVGPRSPKLDDLWAQAGGRLRCSLVRAPLDWDQPERGDVVISMMRLAAAVPDKRRGALLLNPGGPGADGLKLTFTLLNAFAKSSPDSPQGALQLRLLNEYDAVGFSPRGTGASTRLQCATNELARMVETSAAHWDTPDNLANANYNGSKQAEACLKNPITPYINTDATARDMDLMRGLLGDAKLNYLGYSYGTWLGSWYANLFPAKVGRMVLDSSVDFSSTLEQGVIGGQPPARQYLLDNVLTPYAARHAATFQLGATADEVRAAIAGLSPRVQQLLAGPLSNLSYVRADADQYLGTISAARGLDALLKAAPDPNDMDAVADALEDYVFDPADPKRNTAIRTIAADLRASYAATWIQPEPQSIELSTSLSVLTSVHCNDTPATTDLAAWAGLVRGLAQRSPLFGPGTLDFHACAFWGGPKVNKPELAPMKPLDLLFVQSQYDSATYTEGANRFFAQLPAARRVFVAGDYQHGVYPYNDSCVDPIVTSYLLGESPPQRESTCQGHPLEQDKAPDAAQDSQAQPKSSATPPTYQDPEKAGELIDEFKRGLIPPRQRP